MRLILKSKCPHCKNGDIFSDKGNLILFQSPKMNDKCENCSFKFEKEPGFFFGAMFVSYAIAVAQFIAFVIISHFVFDVSLLYTYLGIIVLAFVCASFNFKLSRTIWIYFFYRKSELV